MRTGSFKHNVFVLSLLASAVAALAQPLPPPRQIFSSVLAPGGDAGGLSRLYSVDATAGGRVTIMTLNRIYAGTSEEMALIRTIPVATVLPNGNPANLYFESAWGTEDGHFIGAPNEVFVLGQGTATDFTTLLYRMGPVPGLPPPAVVPAGFLWPMCVVASDSGEILAPTRLMNHTSTAAIVRLDPPGAPRESATLFLYDTDPHGRPSYRYGLPTEMSRIAGNENGEVVFDANLYINGGSHGRALLHTADTGTRVIIDNTMPLPPPLTGGTFVNAWQPASIDIFGNVAFLAQVQGVPGVFDGVMRWRDGTLECLMPSPLPLPQLGAGVMGAISTNTNSAILVGGGDIFVTFRLSGPGVSGSNDFLMAVWRDGQIVPIYREGDSLPGMPAGVNIHQIQTYYDYLYANTSGHLAFQAGLDGNRTAIFSWSRAVGLRKILATGDTVDFDGSPRVVSSLPSTNALRFGNYWLNSANGGDDRLTMLDSSGVLYAPVGFLGTEWGVYALQLPDVCPIDANHDGFVDFMDFSEFVQNFEAGAASGDFNGDAFIDFFDYADFVAAFERGC